VHATKRYLVRAGKRRFWFWPVPGSSLSSSVDKAQVVTDGRLESIRQQPLEILADKLAAVLRSLSVLLLSRSSLWFRAREWSAGSLWSSPGARRVRQYGIPFPNTFLQDVSTGSSDLFRTVRPSNLRFELEGDRAPALLARSPGFTTLRDYLGDPPDALKLIQLSERIADTFDQYLLFRPEMILRWSRAGRGSGRLGSGES